MNWISELSEEAFLLLYMSPLILGCIFGIFALIISELDIRESDRKHKIYMEEKYGVKKDA